MTRGILIFLFALTMAFSHGQVRKTSPWSQYPVFLIRYPSVQKDLGLSAGTTQKITQLQKDSERRYMSMISPAPGGTGNVRQPTRKQIEGERQKTESAILVLLSAKQKARLKEIGLQYA